MKRIATLAALAALAAPSAAHASVTHSQQANAYVARVAESLSAYSFRLRVDRFASKDRFAYYLRWRDNQGRICKFRYEPQVVISRATGAMRVYNFQPSNAACTVSR